MLWQKVQNISLWRQNNDKSKLEKMQDREHIIIGTEQKQQKEQNDTQSNNVVLFLIFWLCCFSVLSQSFRTLKAKPHPWLAAATDRTVSSRLFEFTVRRWCEYTTRTLDTQKLQSQAYTAIRTVQGSSSLQGSVPRSERVLRLDALTASAYVNIIQSVQWRTEFPLYLFYKTLFQPRFTSAIQS